MRRLFPVVVFLFVGIGPYAAVAQQWSDCGTAICTNKSVGIGVDAPSQHLHVFSSADALGDGIRISSRDYEQSAGYLILNKDAGVGTPATIQAGDYVAYMPIVINPYGGMVGVGTSLPFANLHVSTTLMSNPRGIVSEQISNSIAGAQLNIMKARGTPGSPLAVAAGDVR